MGGGGGEAERVNANYSFLFYPSQSDFSLRISQFT